MSEDTKQPGSDEPSKPDASEGDSSGTPAPADIPAAGTLAGADAEKTAMVEQAKTRVAAVKESLAGQPSDAPKPPVKKKEEGPKPTDASNHPLVVKLKAKFGDAIGDASEFVNQLSIFVLAENIVEVCDFLRLDDQIPFDYLSDLTCVHYPSNKDRPFEVVYNLFSISANERVRLKVKVGETSGIDTVTSVWPAANWMEREVFDLFGVRFHGHPDLRRLLLPEDWIGHPMRKDVQVEFVENEWTAKHLPEMTDVQLEQLQQRRAYGLEILSVPQEKMMRDIFRGGKEVMSKDK
jgi:NADH-quinone oxidoreductase subunit C